MGRSRTRHPQDTEQHHRLDDRPAPAPESPTPADELLRLQGTAGNAAVSAFLQRQPKTDTPPVKVDAKPGDGVAGLAAELEPVWNGLLDFSKTAMPELHRVKYTR